MYVDGYGGGGGQKNKTKQGASFPESWSLSQQAGPQLKWDRTVRRRWSSRRVEERTSARAGNIICPSESSRRAGPVVIRPETTNTTAVFVRARKRDKRRSVMGRQTETLPCHLSWHRAQTPGWCCCAAYSLWLHFQICNWWDLGQYWGNTAARKFKGVTLRVSQTKWAHREKKNPQHNSDIGCESLHFVFPLPSIRMHFLFSHLALPSAHTPALHIPSSSPAANADGSSQRTGDGGRRCYPCVPPTCH